MWIAAARLRLGDGDNYVTGGVELFILMQRNISADVGFAPSLNGR